MNYRRIPFAPHIQGDSTSGFIAGLNMSKVRLEAKQGAAPGWPGFFGWAASVHPKLYNQLRVMDPDFVQAMEQQHNAGSAILPGVAGDDVPAAAAPAKSQVAQFLQVATQAASAILPLVQQQKILKLQLQRAQQGLPPLDVGAYVDPNQGVNVGINPATQKTLLWLGGGVLGAWLLSRVLGRR
jgi:hypothetical protein